MFTVSVNSKGRTPLESLIFTAKANKLYDEEVFTSLTDNDQKMKYIEMLASANKLALDTRLSSAGYDYANIKDTQLKFYALETEYELAAYEKLQSDQQFQAQMRERKSKQINDTFAGNAQVTGNNAIKTIVDTKYSGDYSAFMNEYSSPDEFFNDEYLAYADNYDEDATKATLNYMRTKADEISAANDTYAQLLDRKQKLLEDIAVNNKYHIEKLAYENASWVAKAGSSMLQMITAPVTEPGNIVEGLLDAALTVTSSILALTSENAGNTLLDIVNADTIPLDTLLADILPYSYITSPYADDNPFKWLYEIETSIIDLAPMALNNVVPGLGTIIYYTSSAGRSAEAYTNEYDAGIGEIIAYTAASTTIEILTEKLSTDKIFGKGLTDKWCKKAVTNKAAAFVKEMVGEGIEEVLSETGSQLVTSILRGENKMDSKQILRAGALGAAMSIFIQGGSNVLTRRRLLGVQTRLTNAETGTVLDLNLRESAAVDNFLSRCKEYEDAGKTLSKHDARLYDEFKKLDIGYHFDKKKYLMRLARIDRSAENISFEYSTQYSDNTITSINTATDLDRNALGNRLTSLISQYRDTKNDLETKLSALADITDTTTSTDEIDAVAKELLPDSDTTAMMSELQQMCGTWTNSLLAADENNQEILSAVNNYYTGVLEDIIDRANVSTYPKSTGLHEELEAAVGTDVQITRVSLGSPEFKIRSAIKSAYFNLNEVFTFTTDDKSVPVVVSIGNNVYINHKYLRATNLTSITKQIELQTTTSHFYENYLDANGERYVETLVTKMYGTELTQARIEQLSKQLIYSALFVPGNDMAIQLSEVNHKAFEQLREYLTERAASNNISIRNVAYRGLKTYDLMLLSRLSADDATTRNLLSGNYSIDELLSELGPDKKRFTFKYDLDASNAGVRVLSAVRHLVQEFGLDTNLDNFYQVISDIKDSSKYTKFDKFAPILNKYSDMPYDQAINLYLRDQFDFEIDQYGTIIGTVDVEKCIDKNKVLIAYENAKPIAITEILTNTGKDLLNSDVVISFEHANGRNKGTTDSGIAGKSLIAVNTTNRNEVYRIVCHELQHHLTYTNHQPVGFASWIRHCAGKMLRASNSNEFIKTVIPFLHENSSQFLLDLAITGHTDLTDIILDNDTSDEAIQYMLENWDSAAEFLYRTVYYRFDFDEQQSRFERTNSPLLLSQSYLPDGTALTAINVRDNQVSDVDKAFFKYFDGMIIKHAAIDVDAKLNNITNGTETFDSLFIAAENALPTPETPALLNSDDKQQLYEKLQKTLALSGIRPTTKQLCSPQFLAKYCVDKTLKAKILEYTPADCKKLITKWTGLVFDAYTGEFVTPDKLFQPAEYIKYHDDKSLILSREDFNVIQLPTDFSIGKYPELDKALNALSNEQLTSARYYVDDRVFTNLREVRLFLDKRPVSAAQTLGKANNPLLAKFDEFVDSMIATGFVHSADFALITHDGKVVAYNSNGKPGETLKSFAKRLKMPWEQLSRGLQIDPTTGEYVGTLESGVMKQLLDAKKVMRAYRRGNTWEAFGKPNYVQDLMLRQMNAVNKDISYLVPGDGVYENYFTDNYRLVVNKTGKVAIDRGQYSEYPEVSWKGNTWYKALMHIIEKYDIRKLSELKQLGFNEDFIDGLTRNYGRAVQAKTVKKLGLNETLVEASRKYSGLEQDVITQFINDDSAHPFARDLLIQNAPVRASTDNLNWSLCSHIRSVNDVYAYLQALVTYSGTLKRKNNNKKYNTLIELIADAKRNYIPSDIENSVIATKLTDKLYKDSDESAVTLKDSISYDAVVSLFLNLDCRQSSKMTHTITQNGTDETKIDSVRVFTPEGLDYSLSGFQVAGGALLRGYGEFKKSADYAGKAISDETDTHGNHVDDDVSVSKIDQATAKGLLDNGLGAFDAISNGPEDRIYRKGITTALQYVSDNKPTNAVKVLEKLKTVLSNENDKQNKELGESGWDSNLKYLYDRADDLANRISIETNKTTEKHPIDEFIDNAKSRIEQSDDKLRAQDTEYQLVTSNRNRLITQYGEKGYQRALEALSARAIFGDSTAISNVNDNISKRLRKTGSASIIARINKLIDSPTIANKLTSHVDNFKAMSEIFKGIHYGTDQYSTMRFKFSNMLSKYYEFVKLLSKGSSSANQLFTEINTERRAIAQYLDEQVLYGDYNFNKIASPDITLYIDIAEQLTSGNITMDEFADLREASFDDRIQMTQSILEALIAQNVPRPVIDRIQRILEDAKLPEPESPALKPRINLNILKVAQERAGLSSETTEALTSVVSKLNKEYAENRHDKSKMSEMQQTLQEASNATFNAKYMTWTYDRLSKEYRKYLSGPAITQHEAEELIKHAARMIEAHDFQSTSDAFRKRAKKAWQKENSKAYKRVKALLYYRKHEAWPENYAAPVTNGSSDPTKDEIEMAVRTRQNYINNHIDAQEHAARAARPIQKSAIQPTKLSEEEQVNRAAHVREYVDKYLYEELSRISIQDEYDTVTKNYRENIEKTIKRYLRDTNATEKIEYILAQMGYPDNPLEDPVQIRKINAILDLYITHLRGDKSLGTYIYERDKLLNNLRNLSLDEYINDSIQARKAQLQAAADAQWWNAYNAAREYERGNKSKAFVDIQSNELAIKRSRADDVKSVDELLQMYNEPSTEVTPALDSLPIIQRYYTTHRSLDKVLEDAEHSMQIYDTTEDSTLNGIINGISQAITEFQYRPMTLTSAIKFINDVRSVLQDKVLNRTLFSWKNNVPIEKLSRAAFTEFVRDDNIRYTTDTSITSFKKLLKHLKSGQFTSHAETLANELTKSADEISGAVRTLVEEMTDATVTTEDKKLDSTMSQNMRQESEDWDIDTFDEEQADWDAALADAFSDTVEPESPALLSDEDLELDFDEFGNTEFYDETEFGSTSDTKSEGAKKSKYKREQKTDTRPIDEQFKPEDEAERSSYKTTKSDLLTRNGVDIAKALEYQFQETVSIDIYGETMDRQRANTQEFVTNPEVSKVLHDLLKNEKAMRDYLIWLAEARAMDDFTSLKAFIILNKIEASPTISFEIRKEAQKLRKYKKSIAGAILGLGNRHGLSPVEEVCLIAMDTLKLTDDERAELKKISEKQESAISAKDFATADAAMKEALKIFEKHQHELDDSINPFGKMEHSEALKSAQQKLANAANDIERKELQGEVERLREQVAAERAVRWHNLTGKITTWRYFAMLSAPSTFFAKNVAGNYVAKGLSRASSWFASKVEKLISKKRNFKYTYTGKSATDSAKQAVNVQLVENGILDGLMSNTVTKYQTGYEYKPSAVRNVTISAVNDELGPDANATIRQLVRANKPFGKFDEQGKTNIFAEGLNRMYGLIFNTMNKYDHKFIRVDILRLTEQLVSDNFTNDEIAKLGNKTADEALLNKFYEIVEFARQEACKTYFRSQPKLYNEFMAILNKHPMAQAIFSTIMPFPRMVINATMTALAYSPLGFIKMVSTLKTDKSMFANIRASQDFGKALTGTIVMGIGALLALMGILDIDQEDPYAGPQLRIGDLQISLEGIEPSSTALIVGAMSILGPRYDNANVFTSAADALLDSTILGEIMDQFGNDSTGTGWIGSLFASYVTQFIPTVLRRITQLIDPGKKNYSGNGKMFKRIAAVVPFLSFAVENKVDPYTGDEEYVHSDSASSWLARFLVLFNAISPTKLSWNTDSDVEIESKAVDAATTGPARTIEKNGEKYEIPKKLYNQYKILRAQLYSQYANELIQTEAYKKLSNAEKAKKLKALQTKATNEARKQLNINEQLNIP